MTYKECISQHCKEYAEKYEKARFIGYNTVFGSRMYGTLNDVSKDKCLEMPVAENLMAGMSFGMCLEGYRPVVCFERHDFMLLALDCIVNHIDKLPWISGDQFKLPIVIRAIVGGREPLNPGPQHTGYYRSSLEYMLHKTYVREPHTRREFQQAWDLVGESKSGAIIIIEHKDFYEKSID